MLVSLILSALLTYTSPVNYEITLAGNFAEPRLNHYHGGIDIKTDGVEGKAILAVSEGYVSKVVMGLYGYGCAVFVRHPDGVTTMYCHLKKLHPRINAVVKRYQYEQQIAFIDVDLKPYECPVAAGQVIAMSGNTGASHAPHLHMEAYRTSTDEAFDPLELLGQYVKDTTPPLGHAFMAYPKQHEGVFCGAPFRQSFRLGGDVKRYTAWGKVGFGIWANDYADNTYNKCGVRRTVLTVDGREVFRADMSILSPTDNRWMNHQGDYDYYLKYGVWFMKSYLEPGIKTPALRADSNRGVVDFNEERDYNFTYTLSDFAGNTREYQFIVTGKKAYLPTNTSRFNLQKLARYDAMTTFRYGDATLTIKPQSLPYDIELAPTVRRQGENAPAWYSFYSRSMPLAKWAKLRLKCTNSVKVPRKQYLKSVYTSRYYASKYIDGAVEGYIRDIGQPYTIGYDDVLPVITAVDQSRWESQKKIKVSIYDRGSGLKWYKAYIDNEFILLEDQPKSAVLSCDLTRTPITRKHRERTLKIIASDNTDNINTFTTHIIY